MVDDYKSPIKNIKILMRLDPKVTIAKTDSNSSFKKFLTFFYHSTRNVILKFNAISVSFEPPDPVITHILRLIRRPMKRFTRPIRVIKRGSPDLFTLRSSN